MEQLLEDQRVRIGIFILITLGLILLVVRFAASTEDGNMPASSQGQQIQQGQDGGTGTGAPTTSGGEEYADSRFNPDDFLYPEYETSTTLPSAPDLSPGNDALSAREDTVVSSPSKEDVVRYLTAYNTFTWLEPADIFAERAVKAGAVPKSDAAQSSIRGILYESCMAAKCSTEALRVSNIVIDEKAGTVNADVLVRTKFGGETFEEVMNCSSQLARGSSIQKGKFSKTFCLGPEG